MKVGKIDLSVVYLKKVYGKENFSLYQGFEVIWNVDDFCCGDYFYEIWNDWSLMKKQFGVFQGWKSVIWSVLIYVGFFFGYCFYYYYMSYGYVFGYYYQCYYCYLYWFVGYCVYFVSLRIVFEIEKYWVQVLLEFICYFDESFYVFV